MKKCKSCKAELEKGAVKCKHCGTDQRSWFGRHKILTGILIIVIVGIIGSASGGDKSNQSNNPNSQTAKAQKEEQKPMVIEASTLANAFDTNQVAAEKEWGGKLVQFSAEISNITDSGVSFYNVATEKEYSGTQISCRIKDKEQLLPLKNGQVVTVKGVVGSQTIGVIGVDDCEVVK